MILIIIYCVKKGVWKLCSCFYLSFLSPSVGCKILRLFCRMEELIPILLQYVRSRQKPGGYVVWIAHNARCFDVPFLINELRRCSYSVPSNWLFIDTLPLAREVMKSGGISSFVFCLLVFFFQVLY